MARRKATLAVACAALLVAVGCGEGGVSNGATVSVYVAAALCAEAQKELAREDGSAGEVRVRAVCLGKVENGGRLDLAAIGANARRATEDSTSVGYIEKEGPAVRFSQSILDSAGIAYVDASTGAPAMARLLKVIGDADSSSLRDSVDEALNQT